MQNGHDDDLLFKRNVQELVGKGIGFHLTKISWYNSNTNDQDRAQLGIMYFCGKAYPFCTVVTSKSRYDDSPANDITCYSKEEFDAACESLGIDITHQKFAIGRGFKGSIHHFFDFASTYDTKEFDELCEEHKCPTLVAYFAEDIFNKSYKQTKVTGNPILKDYNFVTVVDPYTAYQELEMYIGGVLGNTETNVATVDDEHRYAGHGFNKESFRKSPGKKRGKNK